MTAKQNAAGGTAGVAVADRPILRFLRPVGRFLAHFVEMCAAMCIGGAVLSLLFFVGATLIGYSNLFEQAPNLSVAVIALSMSLAMVAWMRFRGHSWRPTLEMVAATIVAGVVMIVFQIGLVPASGLYKTQCGLSCLAMGAVMLLRVNLYAGHGGHHGNAGETGLTRE